MLLQTILNCATATGVPSRAARRPSLSLCLHLWDAMLGALQLRSGGAHAVIHQDHSNHFTWQPMPTNLFL